jgi:mRNA-degrading endonuclease toxin of MazEF toxin-antitoxin module
MVMTRGQELAANFKRALFLRAGSIWYLPINYVMDFPPVLLCEDGEGFYKHEEDTWINSKNGKYEYGIDEQEVVIKAKPRPFLVFQNPDLLESIQELRLPKHYGNVVAGFPITGLENLEQNTSSQVDVSRLTSKNDYEFIHYIPNLEQGDFSKGSCVLLNTPRTLMLNFFTTHIGCLNEDDMLHVKQKIARIFELKI